MCQKSPVCPGINGVVGREMVGFESRGVPAFLETTGADGAVKCLKWILDPNSKGER